MALTTEQKAQVMQIANAYDEELLTKIAMAITDSGIMRDMLTDEDIDTAEQMGVDVDADDFDIMDVKYDWEFRQAYDELQDVSEDMEEACEHLLTLI
jgi:hypothetical protein